MDYNPKYDSEVSDIDSVLKKVLMCLRHEKNLSRLAELGKHKRYLQDKEQLMIDKINGILEKNLRVIMFDIQESYYHNYYRYYQ